MTPRISFFNLSPKVVRETDGLHQRLEYMGLRHLECDAVIAPQEVEWCKANGYRLIVYGDSFMRTPGLRAQYCTEERVTETASAIRGICDGIEMVDEVRQYPAEYSPHADYFRYWWRLNYGPPMSWPGLAPQRWEKPEWSDYISRQWNWWSCKGQNDRLWRLRGAMVDVPKDGRQVGALIDVTGHYYKKRSPGMFFNPRKDHNLYSRKPPTFHDIREQIDRALSMGATQLRLYGFDFKHWQDERANEPIGGPTWLQTGIWPGDVRWPDLELLVRDLAA